MVTAVIAIWVGCFGYLRLRSVWGVCAVVLCLLLVWVGLLLFSYEFVIL